MQHSRVGDKLTVAVSGNVKGAIKQILSINILKRARLLDDKHCHAQRQNIMQLLRAEEVAFQCLPAYFHL
ncbi:hypothetical protein L580_1397 [Serratia fonticola AU-P3(3)]|nr:hypothetical protein L580_1397 [Serratia fonticola AU-P3(3)]